ncbi:MAG: hypothetical protein IT517_12050 [Burkholderiales bacterium]|nr:hypothetical protein [Burkholderiales bacterium]
MHRPILIAAFAAVPMLAVAAEPPNAQTKAPVATAASVPQVSQARLDQIRRALVAQIAVYEQAEGAMRAPTTAEAAALAVSPSGTAGQAIALPKGGVAFRPDISDASLLRATREPDGRIRMGHGDVTKAAANDVRKGDGHAH